MTKESEGIRSNFRLGVGPYLQGVTKPNQRGKQTTMVELNWLWIVIGIVAIFMAYKVGKQKGKVMGMGKTVPVLFFLLIIGVSAYYSGLYDYIKGEVPVTAVTPQIVVTPTQPVTTLCAVEDTTVTLSTTDAYTLVSTAGTHAYRINGAPRKEVSDAGTITTSPGDKLEILWFNASTIDGSNYFSDVSTEIVPCVGTKTYTKMLYKNVSNFAFSVWNQEGVQIDGALASITTEVNETVGPGDVPTLKAEIQGQYQRGMPHGAVIVCEYNTTTMDDCIVDFGGQKTAVPNVFKVSHTDHSAKAYTIPALLSNAMLSGTVTLDIDDTNSPAIADDENPVIWVYPINYFINEDKAGIYELGAEDEKDVATGLYGWPFKSIIFLD